MSSQPLGVVAWRFTDGKRGHDNQSAGLLQALTDYVHLSVFDYEIATRTRLGAAFGALLDRPTRQWTTPTLLIGAGHATHSTLLAARWARGGRAIVLMKPSMPLAWFDLCVVPEHDDVALAANVLTTRGALNRLRPAPGKHEGSGLVLLGGPSRHHEWDDDGIRQQIESIARRCTDVRWAVVSSRRTPPNVLTTLAGLKLANLDCIPFDSVNADWLPSRLAHAPVAWVSADSASMVYEALTAGAATGVLELPLAGASGADRVNAGLERLVADRWVTPYRGWREGADLPLAPCRLDESDRCARWIVDHWLSTGR